LPPPADAYGLPSAPLAAFADNSDDEDLVSCGVPDGTPTPAPAGDASPLALSREAMDKHAALARVRRSLGAGFTQSKREQAVKALGTPGPTLRSALAVLCFLSVEGDSDASGVVSRELSSRSPETSPYAIATVVRAMASSSAPDAEPGSLAGSLGGVPCALVLEILGEILNLADDPASVAGDPELAVLRGTLAAWSAELRMGAQRLHLHVAGCASGGQPHVRRALDLLFSTWLLRAVARAASGARETREHLQISGAPRLGTRPACSVVASLCESRSSPTARPRNDHALPPLPVLRHHRPRADPYDRAPRNHGGPRLHFASLHREVCDIPNRFGVVLVLVHGPPLPDAHGRDSHRPAHGTRGRGRRHQGPPPHQGPRVAQPLQDNPRWCRLPRQGRCRAQGLPGAPRSRPCRRGRCRHPHQHQEPLLLSNEPGRKASSEQTAAL